MVIFCKIVGVSSVGMRFVKNCHALSVEVDYIPWLFLGRSIRDSRHNLYRKKIKKTHYYPPKRTKKSDSGECLLFSRCLILGLMYCLLVMFGASLLRYGHASCHVYIYNCHSSALLWTWSMKCLNKGRPSWTCLGRQWLVWNALTWGTCVFWDNLIWICQIMMFPSIVKSLSHQTSASRIKYQGFFFSLGKLLNQENRISPMSAAKA